jgi:PPOX class probable F420-dependent enzyme
MVLDADVRAFLDAPRSADLGTINPDGSPQLSIIWYERRGDEVIVNTTATRIKARNMDRDPRVSLLVGDAATYVRLDGAARVVATGMQALADIRALAVRYDGEERADRQARDVWSTQRRVTYAIAIRRVYRYGFD